MGKRGPQPLDSALKAARGTLRPGRERARVRSKAKRPPATRRKSAPVRSRNFVEVANGYLRDVLAGRIVACEWVRLACERQERDIKRAATESRWPYRWSDEHAADICQFAETLPHVEGEWTTPTVRLEPWQIFLLTTLFGWRRKSDGRRRFNTAYIEVARKSAKSVLASIVALYTLHREQEPGGQVKTAATTGGQARIVFDVCKKMVLRTPALRAAGLQVFANSITHEASGSSLQPINAKSSTQDGLNPHCSIIDELHAHKDRGLFDVLKSARGARKNPLSFYVTTAGYDLLGVAYEQRTFLTKVLQRVFSAEHYFGIIYSLDEGDEWTDERVWIKSNPMIGITPNLDEMRAYCREAQDSPASEGEFKTKRLNLWLSGAINWLSLAQWDACADPNLRLEDFDGELACIGADLAQKDDLAALAITFLRDDVLYGFVKFYLPRLVVEQRSRAVPAYRLWADAGVLTLTEGNTLDERVVEADVRAWCQRFDVRAIAFDQFGSSGITTRLAADGLPAILTAKNAKTFTEPSRDLEVRVRQQLFRHNGNPILRWNASNVCVTRKIDDSVLPKKDHPDSPQKIDGIDALLLAMGGLSRSVADDTGGSVYDNPDSLFVIEW